MCAVSMVFDYGYKNPPWNWPTYPNQPLPDSDAWKSIKKYLEMIEKAKEFDEASKQPNCEDPKKAEFMEEVLKRLDAIEKRLKLKP